MVFSSESFLFFFLPITLLLYSAVHFSIVVSNLVLLVASLLFYTWGGGEYVFVLLGIVLINWILGWLVEIAKDKTNRLSLKLTVSTAILFNLSVLGYLKYTNFFVDQLNSSIAYAFHLDEAIQWPHVMLPIGISFYIFQSMSYVIDVARGSAKGMKNFANFALYVAMFPQLIAGPIVRYHEISEQIEKRTATWSEINTGVIRFAHGLAKKVLIADSVAVLADRAFVNGADLYMLDAWVGLLAYTIQIYFDFSGYSDMAIGLGRIFGFRFPENFRHPYSSISITDFWRRWHITLSNWFRDYVYIPLGGSRTTAIKTYRNLAIVFLLTGFWHGANWTFVIWGIYHGFWLVLERLMAKRYVDSRLVDNNSSRFSWTINFIMLRQRIVTFFLVTLGWVLFRSSNLAQAKVFYQTLFSIPTQGISGYFASVVTTQSLIALLIGCSIAFFPRQNSTGEMIEGSSSYYATAFRIFITFFAFPLSLMMVITNSFSPFLYFQF